MGDANVSPGEPLNIDTLRKLALLSMPKRQGRNLTPCNPSLKSEGPTAFPSPAAKPPEDKEEGELSSDDDAEGAAAKFASVEPASNQDQAAVKSHIPSQGSTKEMLAPGANFTGFNSDEGLSAASVAEAFLASLRIPVPRSSRGLGDDKKEDDFVIKFDEDSDSDREHQPSLSSSSTQLGSSAEKVVVGNISLPNAAPVLQPFSAGTNQNPSGLKSEIDRMKKQIAAMERSKGKPAGLPVMGKSTRVISGDINRPSVSAATDSKPAVQVSTGHLRSVPDLESLRLQIAAKESELQQRRQRLAVRGPEVSKVASDAKGVGVGVLATNLPAFSRMSREGNCLAGPPANSTGNVSVEKMLAPVRKKVSNQAEGLIALASIGQSGVCLAGYKKDARLSGGDRLLDHQDVNDDMKKLPSSRTSTYLDNSVGRQLVSKGTKRSHAEVESVENAKMARIDAGPPLPDNLVGSNTSKESTLSEILAVTVNGSRNGLPVQATGQSKRKVDEIEISNKAVTETPVASNFVGSDTSKKLKLITNSVAEDVSRVERFSNPETSVPLQLRQVPRPMLSAGSGQTCVQNEKVIAGISSSTQVVESASLTSITLRSAANEGEDGTRGQKAVIDSEEASPGERSCGANTAAQILSADVPSPVKNLASISADEDDLLPKIHKPKCQHEGSHALPALAGVCVPDAGVPEPLPVTEPLGKKHDVVSRNQQVRESSKVKTGVHSRLSSLLLPTEARLEHPAQQSLGFGYTSDDNWDADHDGETFEQLQAEEELLDKELEEAQEERHRCELKERVARKEYREAQRTLREVNAQCELLNQRKEFLLSRIHLVEGRQYSRKLSASRKPWLISSVDSSLLRLTGVDVTPPCSPKKHATFVEQCAVSLPLQPSREPGSCGADGEQMVAIQVESSLEYSQGSPALKQAGATIVGQLLREESLSTKLNEDHGSTSRVALLNSGLQHPVVHGLGGDVVLGRKVMDCGYSEKLGISVAGLHTDGVDLPLVVAAKSTVISSSTPNTESQRMAVTLFEAKAHDDSPVRGQLVGSSTGVSKTAGFDKRYERSVIEGKQGQTKSDASLPLSGHTKKQGQEFLAITGVSQSKLSVPVLAHEYSQTPKVGLGEAPGRQDKQIGPGSSASSVGILLEDGINLSEDPCTVSGERTQGTLSGACSAEEGKYPSKSSMTPSKEDKSMAEKSGQVFAEENTTESVSKFVQDGSASGWQLDASTSGVFVSISSGDVGQRGDLQPERVHNVQVLRGPKSGDSEDLEVVSSVDLGLKGLSKSTHDLTSSSIKDKAFDAPHFQDGDDGDSEKKCEVQVIHFSAVDGKRDEFTKMGRTVGANGDGTVDNSPETRSPSKQKSDDSEDRATDYHGLLSEGSSLNGVEEPDLESGINLSGELTAGGCQLLQNQVLVSTEAVSEGNKTSPTATNSGTSQQILSETRRGYLAESEDLSTCSDHVRPREHNKTISSDNSTEEEALCQSTRSAGRFGDMDTSEPDEGIHSGYKLEVSKNVNEVQSMEDLNSMEDTEDRSCLLPPGSRPEFQREKTLGGGIPSVERRSLLAIETRHETEEQYSFISLSATSDNVVRTNLCSPEVQVTNDLLDRRSYKHGAGPKQEQQIIVPPNSNHHLVSKSILIEEDAVREDGLCSLSIDQSDHHRLVDAHSVVIDQSPGREDESTIHRATSDREPEKDLEWQILEASELKEFNSPEEIENSKGDEVEIIRKALWEGSVYKRSSGDEETVAVIDVQTPRKEADKETILPQMQNHLLDQLSDMVEVGTQATVVREGQSMIGPLIAVLEDNGVVEAHTAQVNCSEEAAQRSKSSQVLGQQKAEVVSNIRIRGFSQDFPTSEHWVPSAVDFVSLRCIRGIVAAPVDTPSLEKISEVEDKDYLMAVNSPAFCPRYESPLTVFRAYRSLPQFASVMQLSSSSNTWSHAINPHKPLCRFEHRGQCRNEHCPWQHADDYTLSTPFSPETQNKGSPSIQLHDYEISVPTYRVGYYTLKAEDPTSMRLGIPGIQRKVKTEIYHSFLLSPSIHRILPSDSPCLLDTSKSKLSTIEASNASQVPHWRYTGKLREERVFNENGSLEASKDVELWLELALNHIDFDITSEKHKARDEALCILSRGLETKQNSVTLWMAYSCLFHTRRDNRESDDMFQFAIQYNPGSYELWLLYINSRPDVPSRVEAYERAIVSVVKKGTQDEIVTEDSSAHLLDLALQMLYCMCVSGSTEDAFLWVQDLIHDTCITEEEKIRRGSTSALLSHLTSHDGCILWICCAYLSACAEMPLVVTRRLGCKQDLPYTLDWDTHASSEESACLRTMNILRAAASSARGCLSLEDPHPPTSNKKNESKEVLGVNYVQCLAFYEGLEIAGRVSQHLIDLYPTSLELILLYARIEERRAGIDAGLQVFEVAASRWPVGQPGIIRLWNQYAVHGLVWGGNLLAHTVLSKSIASTVQEPSEKLEDPLSTPRTSKVNVSTLSADVSTVSNLENASSVMWNDLRDHYLSLTSPSSRKSDVSTSLQSRHAEDTVYALMNLALIEALIGDQVASQSTINKAMKIAVSDRDSRQCWKELASLQFSAGDVKKHKMIRLLDRCKTESSMLSQLKPFSLRVVEDLKRPQVRKFFVDLLGLLPVDHSLLNSVLEICYGPSLLPFESLSLKDVFHFAEGILEAMPGNVEVSLSLCKIVFQESGSARSKSLSSTVWASALLLSSLQHSCPAAPEVYWVEAGLLLRQLSKAKSLEEYYLHALVTYPFSAALRHGLEEARIEIQKSEGTRRLQQEDMVREVAGLIAG